MRAHERHIQGLSPSVCSLGGEAAEKQYKIWTLAGTMVPTVVASGMITVDMGEPELRGPEVPTTLKPTRDDSAVIDAPMAAPLPGGKDWKVTCVSMGNPHCITFVDDLDAVDLAAVGPQFENHPVFPARVNTEFVQVLSKSHLKMKVRTSRPTSKRPRSQQRILFPGLGTRCGSNFGVRNGRLRLARRRRVEQPLRPQGDGASARPVCNLRLCNLAPDPMCRLLPRSSFLVFSFLVFSFPFLSLPHAIGYPARSNALVPPSLSTHWAALPTPRASTTFAETSPRQQRLASPHVQILALLHHLGSWEAEPALPCLALPYHAATLRGATHRIFSCGPLLYRPEPRRFVPKPAHWLHIDGEALNDR
eukprot:scaffold7415_cov267-Pinguiococcus_pyrenoidosus.AAC.1